MLIDLGACVPFSKFNSLAVPLHNFQNEIKNGEGSTMRLLLVLELIIISEMELKGLIEKAGFKPGDLNS